MINRRKTRKNKDSGSWKLSCFLVGLLPGLIFVLCTNYTKEHITVMVSVRLFVYFMYKTVERMFMTFDIWEVYSDSYSTNFSRL